MEINHYPRFKKQGLVKYEFYHAITGFFIDHILNWIIMAIIAMLVGWFKKPILMWIVILLIVVVVSFCFLVGLIIKKRAEVSKKVIQKAISLRPNLTAKERDELIQSIYNQPPIGKIRIEYNIDSLVHLASVFSKALSSLGAQNTIFSEDDLGLIQFWIEEDSELRSTLKNLEDIPESTISSFFSGLFKNSGLTNFQREQLLDAFLDFTGPSSKLDSIQHKIYMKSQEE